MEIFENEEELYHHGIRGQKWGLRRYQNKDGSLTPAGRKRYMTDANFRAKYASNLPKTKPEESAAERHARLKKSTDANELYKYKSELSNEELRDRIQRIQLEQQLSTYVKKEPTKIEKAQKRIEDVTKKLNKVNEFAKSPAGKMIINKVKKEIGIETPKINNDYQKFLRDISSKTNEEVRDMLSRLKNERELEKLLGNANNTDSNNSGNPADRITPDQINRLRRLLDEN